VIPCCDLPYQYMETYFSRLDDADFNPISNLQLSKIDQGTYDLAWELSPCEARKLNAGLPYKLCRQHARSSSCRTESSVATVLDLRWAEDFACTPHSRLHQLSPSLP
jgi:hypothetical protein